MKPLTQSEKLKFWTSVIIGADCWLWMGNVDKDGYGRIYIQGKTRRAHRVSFLISTGYWSRKSVCHSCDEPSCMNPTHLWEGTNGENNSDRARKGRSSCGDDHWTRCHPEKLIRGDEFRQRVLPKMLRYGEAVNTAKLTEAQVRYIRKRHASGTKTILLARKYGVRTDLISRVVRRKTWMHI